MMFHEAFTQLLSGEASGITRKLWEVDGLHVSIHLQKPDKQSKMTSPYLYIRTWDRDKETTIVPWEPSNSVLFADDWECEHNFSNSAKSTGSTFSEKSPTISKDTRPMITLVACGNHQQFKEYVREFQKDPRECKYIGKPEDVQGYDHRGAKVQMYGTYWHHPQWDAIEEQIALFNSKP